MRRIAAIALVALAVPAMAARRDIVVSAEDGKPVRPGDSAATVVPDALGVLEWTKEGLRRIGSVAVPASMTGPPEAVKVTPDGKLAIVTAAQRRAPTGQTPPLVPDNTVSVVDLSNPARPRRIQTLKAGAGASGVAIDRTGRIALVAAAGADRVFAYRIAGGRLTPIADVALPAGSRPVAIGIAGDGRSALVSAAGAHRLIRLTIADDLVTMAGGAIALDTPPAAIAVSPGGRLAYVAAASRIVVIDMARMEIVGGAELGRFPEGIALSPDGRRLVAVLLDGSQFAPGAAGYRTGGALRLYRVDDASVTPLGETATPPLCQGATWRRDGERIALQCAGTRTIDTYRIDGDRLSHDVAPPIATAGRGGSMAGVAAR